LHFSGFVEKSSKNSGSGELKFIPHIFVRVFEIKLPAAFCSAIEQRRK